MRLKINGHDVEAAAADVAELLRLLGGGGLAPPRGDAEALAAAPSVDGQFLSEDEAFAVVTRLPLPAAMGALFRRLDAAGEAWTSALELQEALDFSTREFAGLLGAFGRRVSHTPGIGDGAFFHQTWNHEKGYNLYRLPDSVRAGLRKAGVI